MNLLVKLDFSVIAQLSFFTPANNQRSTLSNMESELSRLHWQYVETEVPLNNNKLGESY